MSCATSPGSLLLSVAVVDAVAWLTTNEASRRLGVNQRTVYRLIDDGELPAYKFGRLIRVREPDLERFVESARISPGSLEHLRRDSRQRRTLRTRATAAR